MGRLILSPEQRVAAHLGHRTSRDFDVFAPIVDAAKVAASLSALPDVRVIDTAEGTLHLMVHGVPVSVLEYRYPLLETPARGEDGIPIAALEDLACMKLSAIAGRGAARDFWDLHEILKAKGWELEHVLSLFGQKYPRVDTEGYFWDGNHIIGLEKPGVAVPNGLVAHYIYATKSNVPDLMYAPQGSAWKAFRIISDPLGSVKMVVRVDNDAVYEWHDYSTWGIPVPGVGTGFDYTPFGFAGGLYDTNTGLYRFGARDYMPWSGRWWSKDSSRFAGGLNMYAYCNDDPVNCVDPSGLRPEIDRYSSAASAAYAALADIQALPGFLRNNFEFGGYIFKHDDGTFSYSSMATDWDHDNVHYPDPLTCRPYRGWEVGTYHNHNIGKNSGPSDDDVNSGRGGTHHYPDWTGYLSNSNGEFVSYYPRFNEVSSSEGLFPYDADDP